MLPSLSHPLKIESPADDDAAFSITGHACHVVGSEAKGIYDVVMNGRRVLGECCVTNALCTHYGITPLGIERQLRVGTIGIVEKTVASPTEPAFVIEWSTDADVDLTLAVRDQAADLTLQLSNSSNLDSVVLRAGEPVQLVASLGAVTTDIGAWVRMHRAAAERRESELLRLDVTSSRAAAALAWAAFRVTQGRVHSLDDVLAVIALGDFSRARSEVAGIESDEEFLALVARYFAASGDDAFMRASWSRVLAASGNASLERDTWQDLAHVAEAVGDLTSASAFKQKTRDAAPRTSWPEFVAGDSTAGYSAWQQVANLCFEGEKGAWPRAPGHSAADVILGFTEGMLGFDPDASRGRMRLRTQLPADWERVTADNLRIGDARVRLDYERSGDCWRFDVSQTEGAFPVRLIFEPALPSLPHRMYVDGNAAQLDLAPFGERVVAPVQIMLDERRRVEFYA